MLVDVRDPSGTWRLPAFYGFHAASVPDPEPDPAPDPEPDPAPQPTAPSGEPDGRHERAERSNCVLAKKHVARHGNAMKLCIDRALKIGDWYEQRTGRPMPESWLQGMATSFYIAMKPDFDYKTGQPRVGMIDSLPDMKDISEVFPGLDTPPASAGQ